MSTSSPEAVKKLLENMQTDLRSLSMECKKKFPPVKEAAESGIVKIKTIAARNTDILAALKENSSEVVQPFLMGCGTKEPKITQLCLAAIQRLMSHEVVSEAAAGNIINMLWQLMENGLEELKLLQTVLVLLTTNTVVHDEVLSKAIVLCFRLHFTKDNITNNTAAATVRQVVTVVFERMVAEDERFKGIVEQPPPVQGNTNRRSVSTLRPSAKDAYMLFQDLCQLVNADAPYWLVGMTEMTRTFGLELLESVLNDFPGVFLQHQEFSFLLKERVCPLVIKLFSPNIKFRQGSSSAASPAPVEKPYFPICMRLLRVVSVLIKHFYSLLVTECEIFLSLLVKFLDGEKPQWLRAVAVESVHRLCVQPHLLRSFCQSYDMKQHSTKVFRDIVNALGSFIQSLFIVPSVGNAAAVNAPAGGSGSGAQGTAQGGPGTGGVSGSLTTQAAFEYRGTWIPLMTVSVQGSAKATYLEMLDKVEPPSIPEGYAMSVAFSALLDLVRGITSMIERELAVEEEAAAEFRETYPDQEWQPQPGAHLVWEEMVSACWCGLLAALSLLLDASTDETATENILKAELTMASLCGRLGLVTPRDAFITAICKASLPPHYALTVLSSNAANLSSKAYSIQGQSVQIISPSSESHQQVVAVGQPLTAQPQGTVVLTAKNIQCMRTLLNLAHCHGAVLGTSWQLVLATLQHLVWILGLKPGVGGALKPGRAVEGPSTVLTTAVMTDLPVISNILSRLFESSQYLDDVSLHHLINALCSLSLEAMEMAYGNNKEPSLFAVAKLLETGLVNMDRIEILWRPLTGHLLEKVCQHPNSRMREWGAEALTALIKAGLAYKHDPPLAQNQRLQLLLLNPLKELSNVLHADIRQKQLESVLQILQSQGDSLGPGWPLVLGVIGAIRNDQGESLIRTAFQCLQLVVTDFLPTMPCTCLQIVVDVAGSFGLQNQELNISLTSIGLLWNISDYFFQRGEAITQELEREEEALQKQAQERGETLNRPFHPAPPFDCLWLCLYAKLGELCVDPRPAVRKSAGQTLFSTIAAHGTLLQQPTWHIVVWKVLFHLLDCVRTSSTTADKEKIESGGGNILIHHSRDTAEKQWAETWVLTLAGVARIFNTRRYLLQQLGKPGAICSDTAICVGPENLQVMYPAIFEQLLLFVEFSCKPPQYGRMETKHVANAKYNQIQLFAPAEWVALNYVPFAERSLEVVVDLYHKTACHKAVINEKVLQNIIKTLRMPLGLKYACPSESTWKLAVSSLLKVLSIGLPVARQHASSGKFDTMWPELANAFEDFLFTKSTPPDNLSIQEFQKNEAIDVEVVQLISTEILPFANFIPKDFVGQIMTMLNRGSIHSQSPSFTEAEIDVRMREEFSKVCFETLLQFSFSNKVSTPQEGYISRMALSVLLKRSQDVLRRYVEDERLSGRCPLPRQQVTEIIFVLKAISTLMDSLKKTQPENVDGNTWAQVIALYPTLVECITCSSSEVSSALKEALGPFKDFMQPPVSRVQNGES
uniref:protein MON2 homolog n=1 Tax=Epinephelus lanceolatus TaxID=310571 RepID=UPI001446CFD3|nr:protein MON2 homolog [Epinephelus lanceolatus]